MSSNRELVCIIPARSGSKRIPKKNLLKIGNEHALGLTIASIIEAKVCQRVIVTTDSQDIADVASRYGAEVPFLREARLADDHTTTAAVIRDAAKRLNLHADTLVMCSYPLSLLRPERIREFVFNSNPLEFNVTIGRLRVPPARILSIGKSGLYTMNHQAALNKRTQDLSPGFFDAGKLYLAKTALWESRDNMLSGAFSGFELDYAESIDVDTEDDWAALLRIRGAQ